MDNRKEKRLYGLKNISIVDGEEVIPAVMVDISQKGICVRCSRTLPTYKEIILKVEIDEIPLMLRANVRWVNEPINLKVSNMKEIGFAVIDPPELYKKYLERIYFGNQV